MRKRALWYPAWLLGAAALYFFENGTGTRALLLASVLLPPLFVWLARRAARALTLTLAAPERAESGEAIPVTLTVSPRSLFARAEVVLTLHNRFTGEEERRAIPADGACTATLTAAHCGLLALRAEAFAEDLLGMYRRSAAEAERAVLVLPPSRLCEAELIEDGATGAEGEQYSTQRPGSDPSETFSIREYVPGDPVRQIHWKLSQKTEKLMLREFGLPVSSRTLLCFDAAHGEPDAQALCAAAAGLFDLSRALVSRGLTHTVLFRRASDAANVALTVETEPDWERMQALLLSAAPERDAPLAVEADAESAAHAALFTTRFPAAAPAIGARVTVFAPCAAPAEAPYHAVSLLEETKRFEL